MVGGSPQVHFLHVRSVRQHRDDEGTRLGDLFQGRCRRGAGISCHSLGFTCINCSRGGYGGRAQNEDVVLGKQRIVCESFLTCLRVTEYSNSSGSFRGRDAVRNSSSVMSSTPNIAISQHVPLEQSRTEYGIQPERMHNKIDCFEERGQKQKQNCRRPPEFSKKDLDGLEDQRGVYERLIEGLTH